MWEEDLDERSFIGTFLTQEFTSPALSTLVLLGGGNIKKSEKKEALVDKAITLFELGQLTSDQILLSYVKASRMWLSFKMGSYSSLPRRGDAVSLLKGFGSSGWHGPIKDEEGFAYYIRTQKIMEPLEIDNESEAVIRKRHYRWPVVAKISQEWMSLSWYGFSYSDTASKRANQFPFWLYIHDIFDELESMTEATLVFPDLYQLVLGKLWNKYLNDPLYSAGHDWEHLRIKAEASGVELNEKSYDGHIEVDLKGLKALTKHLATSAIEALEIQDVSSDHDIVENALLKTIIHDWGTKAYEFSLERKEDDLSQRVKKFKAYCNFGLRPELKNEDALLHLKCYSEYGNSNGALEFLLEELAT